MFHIFRKSRTNAANSALLNSKHFIGGSRTSDTHTKYIWTVCVLKHLLVDEYICHKVLVLLSLMFPLFGKVIETCSPVGADRDSVTPLP